MTGATARVTVLFDLDLTLLQNPVDLQHDREIEGLRIENPFLT